MTEIFSQMHAMTIVLAFQSSNKKTAHLTHCITKETDWNQAKME